jgi:predicted metal-binding membrane protein
MVSLRAIGRRPTLWVEGAVAAAWAALLLAGGMAHGNDAGSPAGWSSDPLWICTLGVAGEGGGTGSHPASAGAFEAASLLATMPMWSMMALGMMVPAALPAVRHVARTSLYWRRRRAAAEFLFCFVLTWTAFGLLVLTPLAAWDAAQTQLALAAALAGAALWQLTPLKHRALLACHRSYPLPPRGWRASAGAANFALRNGGACIGSCWAMMAAASLAGPGRLWWMGAMTGVMAAEKLVDRPRWACRRVAALLGAAAAGVALAILV